MFDVKYIDNTKLVGLLPPDWPAKSVAALDEARNAEPNQLTSVIDGKADVWRQLKEVLAGFSSDKCWYCESKDIRSDNAVDHFRPKGRVAEVEDHPGYWWLAFDHDNLRYSCTYCNSRRKDRATGTTGGKHDHFPLLDEGQRAYNEGDDIRAEQPVLLDPTNTFDPTLLWFEPDGRAVPRYDREMGADFHYRANVSIKLLNLNEVKLLTRRKDNHRVLLSTVKDAHLQFSAALANNHIAQKALETAFRSLRQAIHPNTAHSASARAMLSAYIVDYPWLTELLTTQG